MRGKIDSFVSVYRTKGDLLLVIQFYRYLFPLNSGWQRLFELGSIKVGESYSKKNSRKKKEKKESSNRLRKLIRRNFLKIPRVERTHATNVDRGCTRRETWGRGVKWKRIGVVKRRKKDACDVDRKLLLQRRLNHEFSVGACDTTSERNDELLRAPLPQPVTTGKCRWIGTQLNRVDLKRVLSQIVPLSNYKISLSIPEIKENRKDGRIATADRGEGSLAIGIFPGEAVRLNEFPSREIIGAHSSFLSKREQVPSRWLARLIKRKASRGNVVEAEAIISRIAKTEKNGGRLGLEWRLLLTGVRDVISRFNSRIAGQMKKKREKMVDGNEEENFAGWIYYPSG